MPSLSLQASTLTAGQPISSTCSPVPSTAKWGFTTRRVPPGAVCGLSSDYEHVMPGDLILVRTVELGQHAKVQLASRRNSENIVGDLLVMAVGNRYAPDQFEGEAVIDPDHCAIIAGGGIVGRVTAAHGAMVDATRVEPLGLLLDTDGEVMNLAAYALPDRQIPDATTVIGVFGTSMNSGKTTSAMSLALGLRRAGFRVAGVKATGTGAFGDYNAFSDAGVPVSDFVDAGMPTTYRMPLERVEAGFERLVGNAAADGAEIVVVELADGVFQHEAAAILSDSRIRRRIDGFLFAAFDSAGAAGGVSVMRAAGIEPLAVSGLLSCSPLGVREARAALGLPIMTRDELRSAAGADTLVAGVLRGAREPLPVAA